MLTKGQLIIAAKDAKAKDGYVGIIQTKEGIELVIRLKAKFLKERNADLAHPDFIKGIQPDSILKYDWSTWESKDCSIQTLVDEINKKYGQNSIRS